jgi:PqqD family protein of HPr-rel-A system
MADAAPREAAAVEPLWTVRDRTFLERRWAGEAVVYDTYSGATHHLNAAATQLWTVLHAGAARSASALRDAANAGGGDWSLELIGKALEELNRLELVESRQA